MVFTITEPQYARGINIHTRNQHSAASCRYVISSSFTTCYSTTSLAAWRCWCVSTAFTSSPDLASTALSYFDWEQYLGSRPHIRQRIITSHPNPENRQGLLMSRHHQHESQRTSRRACTTREMSPPTPQDVTTSEHGTIFSSPILRSSPIFYRRPLLRGIVHEIAYGIPQRSTYT